MKFRAHRRWPRPTHPSGPEDGVVFFRTAGVALELYPYGELAADVDRVLELALAAGAEIVKPAQDTFWGGYSGYFTDPDGYLWEVAWGAFEFRADGSLLIT